MVIVTTGSEHYKTTITDGRHEIFADKEVSHGGTDSGLDPYDLLLASLGSCTTITLRMYVDRKKWDVEKITVQLSHEKKYLDDCVDCDNPKNMIDVINRSIQIVGDIDEKQKKRILQIADKCPVHKTLMSQISVLTKISN